MVVIRTAVEREVSGSGRFSCVGIVGRFVRPEYVAFVVDLNRSVQLKPSLPLPAGWRKWCERRLFPSARQPPGRRVSSEQLQIFLPALRNAPPHLHLQAATGW